MATFGQIPLTIGREELEDGWLELVGEEWVPIVLPEFWTALYYRPEPAAEYREWLAQIEAKPIERVIGKPEEPFVYRIARLLEFRDAAEQINFKMRWL